MSLQLDQLHLDEPIESVRLPDELLSSSAAFSSQPDAFPMLMNKFNRLFSFFFNLYFIYCRSDDYGKRR